MNTILVDLSLALTMGAVSSLHCAGMCGPIIAVSFGSLGRRASGGHLVLGQVAYHGGRAVTYVAVGTILGGIGTAITSLFATRLVGGGIQVAVGLAIVVLGVTELLGRGLVAPRAATGGLSRIMGRALSGGGVGGLLLLGLLTGLLPCGVLYAAFARAVAAGTAWEGGALLAAFWLGTVPLLAAMGFASGGLLRRIGRFAPVLLFLALAGTGGWVAWKGVRNLQIWQAGETTPSAMPCHEE